MENLLFITDTHMPTHCRQGEGGREEPAGERERIGARKKAEMVEEANEERVKGVD